MGKSGWFPVKMFPFLSTHWSSFSHRFTYGKNALQIQRHHDLLFGPFPGLPGAKLPGASSHAYSRSYNVDHSIIPADNNAVVHLLKMILIFLMLVQQCHKPSPSHHHLYGWDSNHQFYGWFMAVLYPHYAYNLGDSNDHQTKWWRR